jgi:2-dehydro-3-deoxygalactonokinase
VTWRALGDWGTSNLRLYRVEKGAVTGRCDGPGIGALTETPSEALHGALASWWKESPPTQIDLCGMAGSRNGLHEVGYLDCPASAAEWAQAVTTISFEGVPLRLGSGLACYNAQGGPDVMRGEEAQIFGVLALHPDLRDRARRIVLPGTHSKWAVVEQGRIRSFRTCLTGEMFALLRDRSILLALGGADTGGDDECQGFDAGLDRAAAGAGLVGSLFETRAQQLRGGRSAGWALGFLSGLVIGNEIADMRDADGLPDEAVLVGASALTARYSRALLRFGVASRQMDADACVLSGLELIDAHR